MGPDKLNRWLTLGANVGVLIGLLLLVVELRQNQEMMRAQTRHDLSMGIIEVLLSPANNEQLSNVMYRANIGGELTPEEQFQYILRTNALFRYWENVHYQYRVGLYDEIEFAKQRDAWEASLVYSIGMRTYWCNVRTLYSPEFMAEVDAIIPSDTC